jgi:hypothetical protein
VNTSRNPVGWFEIYVQDMARARAFYEAVLKINLQRLPYPKMEMWMFPGDPNRPGSAGTLAKMEGMNSGGGGTLVYFSCADCAVEAARAPQHEGAVVMEKTAIGEYGFIALVRDPDGNTVGLHSMS